MNRLQLFCAECHGIFNDHSESGPSVLMSHLKDGSLLKHSVPITALGHWNLFDLREDQPLLAHQHHFQQHLSFSQVVSDYEPSPHLLSFSHSEGAGCMIVWLLTPVSEQAEKLGDDKRLAAGTLASRHTAARPKATLQFPHPYFISVNSMEKGLVQELYSNIRSVMQA